MLVVSIGALALLVAVLVRTRTGARYDHDMEWALGGPPWLFYNIEARLQQISVTTVGVTGLLLAGIAVLRSRVGLAAGVLVLIGGATVSTQILKNDVIHALPGNTANSLPSGHATVGVSLSLAALLALPVAWQRFSLPVCAAVGFFFGAGTVIGHWHHPSDVFAALAVCLAWTAVALVVVQAVESLRSARPHTVATTLPTRAGSFWSALGGIASTCLLFLAWGAQPSTGGLRDLTLGLTAVAAIAAGTLVVYTWVAQAAQRVLA